MGGLICVSVDRFRLPEVLSSVVFDIKYIAQWLNTIAEEKNVNFSQILQDALKPHLGLKQP
ncbi:hypothetical protein DCCM_4173 [Desulfocucumis palustris]|uniref:Uncharacterized protein n=1 Tax=Desulfocucumis palustris TaxID=1898651 RepID=A0A2L2XG06_9FIRM|nr:hypothetical protein DCCM_4173 [Desulfocucumis palustris]